MANWISAQKRVSATHAEKAPSFQSLGIDPIDLVELILKAERAYGINIPDEVPLLTLEDFVQYITQSGHVS
ncbi:MAG: phosphopantetheine-binding protein [Rufibacter sp.]